MQTGVAELLSQHRLKELAAKISLNEARYPGQLPTPAGSGTSYLCAADCQGMVVSYIQSSGPGFGSGIVVPGTGIALQSRASGFNFNPGHPNCYAPNKRPFHTNCPAILTNGDDAVTAFGLMGWSMQPQAHVQFAVRAVDHSQSPTSILAAPRWRIAVDEPAILLEPGFPEKTQSGLAALGHKIIKTEKFFSASTPFGSHLMFGGANMLCKAPTGWNAACDPRRDGLPAGC